MDSVEVTRQAWIVGGAGAARLATAVVEHGGLVAPADPARQRALIAAVTAGAASASAE